jgi:RNA recognition motif-containing protein
MPDRAEGTDALESMNGISLGKKPLVVKEAEERSGPPSGGSGGFRNGGGGGFNNNRSRDKY